MRKQAGGRGKHEKCGKISATGKHVILNSKQAGWRGDLWTTFHSVFGRISMIRMLFNEGSLTIFFFEIKFQSP
jgi:hypothetical protein